MAAEQHMQDSMSEPAPRDVAIQAAQAGARILRRGFGQTQRISRKGLVDLVTEQDRRSEEAIVQTIQSAFPNHAILAEERGQAGVPSRHRWIVDPLDGTTNYAHGYPVFCVSVAYEKDGVLEVGVIVDPLRREVFVAERGQGVTLNGRPARVSRTDTLIDCLLETGFPYERSRMAIALALAYVAVGRLDGFWEATLSPWDHAAGALLIQEAGGIVTQIDGAPYRTDSRAIAASNGLIHAALLEALQQASARIHR